MNMDKNEETNPHAYESDPLQPINKEDKQPKSPLNIANETKLYKRRYWILLIFSLYSMINAFQWIEYSIITNIISRYYGRSPRVIDWLSMIYMAVYIPFIIPASWILNARGLKETAILGAALNAIGAWIKCISVKPHLFWVTFIGQTFCALAQLFVLNIPSKLAATWFGPNEVSTACAIGVFGNEVGVALGFLIPPIMVPNTSIEAITRGLKTMFYSVALVSTAIFGLIITVYKNAPKLPPSPAEMALGSSDDYRGIQFKHSLGYMIKSRNFLLLFFTYGILTGNFYAVSTLLNQIVLTYFPNEELNAGRIGLTMVIAGLVGSIIAGVWLDRTKTFKMTTLGIYVCAFACMIAFTFTLKFHKLWVVFLNIGLLGFFMNGYLPVGFEFATEITYPHSAGISSGLLNASAQLFGIIFTIGMGELIETTSVQGANIFLCASLFFGTIITVFIQSKLRREDVNIKHREATKAYQIAMDKNTNATANPILEGDINGNGLDKNASLPLPL